MVWYGDISMTPAAPFSAVAASMTPAGVGVANAIRRAQQVAQQIDLVDVIIHEAHILLIRRLIHILCRRVPAQLRSRIISIDQIQEAVGNPIAGGLRMRT